jgi:hypothetical protein
MGHVKISQVAKFTGFGLLRLDEGINALRFLHEGR